MPGAGGKNFDELIERLYDAALDGTQMPSAMESIAGAFGATTSLLQVRDVLASTTTLLPSTGFSASHLIDYGQNYWKLDVWADKVKSQPINSAYVCSDLVPERVFANSEIWNDYGRNIGPGTFRAVGATVALDSAQQALIGFHRPRCAPDFARTDRDLLNRLLPHLQRTLQIRARLDAGVQMGAVAYEAMEMLSVPLAVVRANATVLYANAAARALAARNDGFDLGDIRGGINAMRQHESQALRALIAKAALTTIAKGLSAGGALNLTRRSKRCAYRVLVSPLASRLSGGGAVALLLIIDPEHVPVASSVVLGQLFGLTAAEARLALSLASGATLAQSAQRFAVSFQTVRTQLRAIFSKTQTSRQAELMRLMSNVSNLSKE